MISNGFQQQNSEKQRGFCCYFDHPELENPAILRVNPAAWLFFRCNNSDNSQPRCGLAAAGWR